MTPRTRRSIATGLVGALGFTAGLFAGITHDRAPAPPAPLKQTLLPTMTGTFRPSSGHEWDIGSSVPRDVTSMARIAPPCPIPDGALERAYRANLAREGLTPRVSHERR